MINAREGNPVALSSPSRLAYRLSLLLAAVMLIQCVGGLVMNGLYRDNSWVSSIFYGTDLVTLVVVLPLLIWSTVSAARGSARGRLVFLGVVYYAFYNNVYYLFSAFNRFFLVYVAINILSSFTVVAALLGSEVKPIGEGYNRGAHCRWISVVMLICAAILAVMWVGQSGMYIANGQLPQLISDTGSATHMVAICDLTLIVPLLALGAVWLWKGRPWGYAVSTAMLVQCTIITVVLVVGAPFQAVAGIKDAWTMVPLWGLMGIAFLVPLVFMLRSVKASPQKGATAAFS